MAAEEVMVRVTGQDSAEDSECHVPTAVVLIEDGKKTLCFFFEFHATHWYTVKPAFSRTKRIETFEAWKKSITGDFPKFLSRYTDRGDTVFYRAAPDSTSRPIVSYNDLDQLDMDMF